MQSFVITHCSETKTKQVMDGSTYGQHENSKHPPHPHPPPHIPTLHPSGAMTGLKMYYLPVNKRKECGS